MTDTDNANADSSSPSPLNRQVQVEAVFNIDYLDASQYTLVVPIPDTITILIGRIVVNWGAFELRMNALIEHIFTVLPRIPQPGWHRQSFDRRKRLFKDLLTEYTQQMFPNETPTFQAIADHSGDLQWRRNTVAHGYIKARSEQNASSPTGFAPIFYAVNRHNGKDVTFDLTEPALQKLAHDIAHLGGNLMAAIARMGGRLITDSPELVVADKEMLQDAQVGSLRILPTWQTHQFLPASYQVSTQEVSYQWLNPVWVSIF